MSIIRRMDMDADARLSKSEFIMGIKPEEPYSKALKRSESKKRKRVSFRHSRQRSRAHPHDDLIYFDSNQVDVIRTHALDRSIRKSSASRSPLKMRPNFV